MVCVNGNKISVQTSRFSNSWSQIKQLSHFQRLQLVVEVAVKLEQEHNSAGNEPRS